MTLSFRRHPPETRKLGVAAAVLLLLCVVAATAFDLLFKPALGTPLRTSAGLVLVALSGAVAVVVSLVLHRLALERDHYHAVFHSANEAFVSMDARGRVRTWNRKAEGMFGWSRAEALGQRLAHLIIPERDREAHWRRLLHVSKTRKGGVSSECLELVAVDKSGREFPVKLNVWAVNLGGTVTCNALIQDLSDGRPGELGGGAELGGDGSHEGEANELKTSLLSTVSHELRTPLTMIQGFSELLLTREVDEPKSREALEQINSSAERLSRMVDDLLSVARIESGRLAVRIAPVDISTVFDDALDPFVQREPERPFLRDLDEKLPPVVADPDKLVQVLTNLLCNAVKYSPQAAPVSIYARRQGSVAEIGVEDRGIGLSADECSRIFEKFFRSDRDEVQEASGTGLGLYVAKSLVEMQGGRLQVSSEVGRGARFFFHLPLAEVEGEG